MKAQATEMATTLRKAGPGPHRTRELYELYIEVCRAAGYAGGYFWQFTRDLTTMGVPSRLRGRERIVDLQTLADRWPDLDWGWPVPEDDWIPVDEVR